MKGPLPSYLRKVLHESDFLTEVPLFSRGAAIDFSDLSQKLREKFSLERLEIKAGPLIWHGKEEGKKQFLASHFTTAIRLSPLSSFIYWTMGKKEVEKLLSFLLKEESVGPKISSEALQEGFYQYIGLETLDTLSSMEPFLQFTFEIQEEFFPIDEGFFSVDVEIEEVASVWGKLLIPDSFRKEWKEAFSHLPFRYKPTAFTQNLVLSLSVQQGSFEMTQEEIHALKPGDFILLAKGASLALGNADLFSGKLREGHLELVDYTFGREESMDKVDTDVNAQEETLSSLEKIPLRISVEVAQIQMSLDELMQLKPGGVVKLKENTPNSVSLVINGQKVGRGELLHLGESLGVRLLEIG